MTGAEFWLTLVVAFSFGRIRRRHVECVVDGIDRALDFLDRLLTDPADRCKPSVKQHPADVRSHVRKLPVAR